AGAAHAPAGELVEVGPGELEAVPAAVDAQTLVPDPAVLLRHGHTHRDELTDRAGGEPVPADLLPREGRLLQDEDVETGDGEVVGSGRAGRTCADDDDVRIVLQRTRAHARLILVKTFTNRSGQV